MKLLTMTLICSFRSIILFIKKEKNKRGGGVCVFIHKKLLFKQRKNFSICQDSNENNMY